MKKTTVLAVILLLVGVSYLCGCTEQTSDSDGDATYDAIVINIFQVTPSLINHGETANLSWKVTGATAVEINQDIGSLPLEGSRIISPTESTTYTLIASNTTTSVTAIAYIMVTPALSAPNLAWTLNDAEDTITITSGSTSHKYAESPTDANLIFKKGSTTYYLKADLSLGTTETGLSTEPIRAGDVITGFTSGEYQMVWVPTDKLLGTNTFS
ncbi:MAG: hypothetical protein KAW45_01105 [Thermoplasmatales archaeon]|nr:hypothetical protein [Thermoplasmatales archaeon]